MEEPVVIVIGMSVGMGAISAVAATAPDVVLVTLDTCRADRIGAYGHSAAQTESIDALAARGRRYTRAYSPAPLTIPAHSALFTGRSPTTLGLRTNGGGLAETEVTLAERLHQAGYVTAASVGAYVTTRMWGFDQGFDTYFDDLSGNPERPGQRVVDDVLAWRSELQTDQPQFVWVHLFDAHGPHIAPNGSAGDAYNTEIALLDDQVGRLVEAFSRRPTLFVVVGDHGEGLGDHGEAEHGLYVYDSTQHVPYIIAGPGVVPSTEDEPVSLIDVAPTLLSHLGLPPLPLAEGRVAPGSPVVPVQMESWGLNQRFGLAPHRAVVDGSHKLIAVPRPELYDLDADPAEVRDLASAQPERVARMAAMLDLPPPIASDAKGPAGDRTMLAALGYTEADTVSLGPPTDAKDHAELITAVERADRLAQSRRFAEAVLLLDDVHQAYPNVREVTVRLAQLEVHIGRTSEALQRLQDARVRDPDSATLQEAIAQVLAASGRREEAADGFESLAQTRPHIPGIHSQAFDALIRIPSGADRALSLGLERLRNAPGDLQMAGRVGAALARHGELERARPLLEQAEGSEPLVLDVHLFLARLADEGGQPARARRLLEIEVEAHPNSVAAVLALALVLERTAEWQAQLDVVAGALDRAAEGIARTGHAPDADLGMFWALKARALVRLERFDEADEAVQSGLAAGAGPALQQFSSGH